MRGRQRQLHRGPGETDPLLRDTDGDGCTDGVEDKNGDCVYEPAGEDGDPTTCEDNETDPTRADTDGDGATDCEELGTDCTCDLGDSDPNEPDRDFTLLLLEIANVDADTLPRVLPAELTADTESRILRPTYALPANRSNVLAGALVNGHDLELYEVPGLATDLHVRKLLPDAVEVGW